MLIPVVGGTSPGVWADTDAQAPAAQPDLARVNVEEAWQRYEAQVHDFIQTYEPKLEFATVTIGITLHGERRYYVYGPDAEGETEPHRRIYEIGSITKTFTALALADAIQTGMFSLETTLGELAPDDVVLPETTSAITLRELATHTSGLPRLPPDLFIELLVNNTNPYANYDSGRLWSTLEATQIAPVEERRYAYSNFGMGLLGHLLAIRHGTDLEDVYREHITTPWQMSDTVIRLNEEQSARLLAGHHFQGDLCPGWDFDALAGCGALKSTAADMLTYLEHHLNPGRDALGEAVQLTQAFHHKLEDSPIRLGLGWHVACPSDSEVIYFHDGGTGGYISFAGYRLQTATGVVILSNSGDALSRDMSVVRLGMMLLADPQNPTATQVELPAETE